MPGRVELEALDTVTGNPVRVLASQQALATSVITQDVTLATLTAAGVGTVNGADQTNSLGVSYLNLVIDITAISGTTPTLTVTVQGKDIASGKYYTILASAALSTVSTTVLTVGAALPASANASANAVLPRTWRVIYTVGGTGPSVTATIGASLT